MHKTHLFSLLFILLIGAACNKQQHFISDDAFRAEVEKDFQAKQAALPDGDLFTVFNQQMTPEEKEALTFLYAYMPIGDITDYDGKLYLDNIRSSFKAREEMSWGDSIPEEIFRHFVLPIRVNNENLDESRMVFFDELKDRVKGLSLYDAVLEVNHWCHEKVIYTPSDARTSSPLASVKTAYGRCGEESTFTVAALRSVGIPARQVYTPRWAHTDDNHAWVEAWVNGKWYFLGACEPEPVLNLGWFNGPAYRGMLMHTKVFGKYHGPEEVMLETDGYTEINVIDNYAPTGKAVVTVVDADGKPVSGADVEFKIYNYAEFYTVANKKTDAEGKLLNNVIAYEKCGNGIDQLDEVVETKEVKEKILYIEVAYTNTSDQQTGDTMFQCGLLWAKETGDGYETVDVYAKDDVDYDSYYGQNYRISNVPLYYYNGKSAEEKNHLIRVQPGETRTVTLAFLVTEDELPYLYLDLFSGNDDYTQFSQSALLYGYVDIRQ